MIEIKTLSFSTFQLLSNLLQYVSPLHCLYECFKKSSVLRRNRYTIKLFFNSYLKRCLSTFGSFLNGCQTYIIFVEFPIHPQITIKNFIKWTITAKSIRKLLNKFSFSTLLLRIESHCTAKMMTIWAQNGCNLDRWFLTIHEAIP